uniref:Transmembrane protein n=1 Tax=Chromera velia CCMP2878 TaxID=1169474 RepID=A0A0G4HJU7_9ALVE|mmetsp:Transcript_50464/g.99316  ORF Transcript_50464/g.99316 Transcript_50464/m.99316 type:complete len:218 (-) Transcript_50464:86-739(-)|eukprot:Cvel_1115.t1-p1 / transcript=Cvel_1115.t1 / gene=Cvel_1115 / organism=Chromera_velia_CCMP2878 / gene_product=hypothetical protein / transcript_product=hypothetical protein / location=Cvel_scaffold36:143069-145902(-) / protein_length=217 / sequence_SO=supercontig / SO=protein_coding / is_pseudo=false
MQMAAGSLVGRLSSRAAAGSSLSLFAAPLRPSLFSLSFQRNSSDVFRRAAIFTGGAVVCFGLAQYVLKPRPFAECQSQSGQTPPPFTVTVSSCPAAAGDNAALEEEMDDGASAPRRAAVNLCIGSALGIFLGHTLRKVGRIVAAFLGLHFLFNSLFCLLDWAEVRWDVIWQDLTRSHRRQRPRRSNAETAGILALAVGLSGGTYLGFVYSLPLSRYF